MKRMRDRQSRRSCRRSLPRAAIFAPLAAVTTFLGDVDVPRCKRRGLYKKLRDIDARFGSRDDLRSKIALHLISIGRYVDAPSPEVEAWEIFLTSKHELDDEAPDAAVITAYDEAHIATYAALLVAEGDGANPLASAGGFFVSRSRGM